MSLWVYSGSCSLESGCLTLSNPAARLVAYFTFWIHWMWVTLWHHNGPLKIDVLHERLDLPSSQQEADPNAVYWNAFTHGTFE